MSGMFYDNAQRRVYEVDASGRHLVGQLGIGELGEEGHGAPAPLASPLGASEARVQHRVALTAPGGQPPVRVRARRADGLGAGGLPLGVGRRRRREDRRKAGHDCQDE